MCLTLSGKSLLASNVVTARDMIINTASFVEVEEENKIENDGFGEKKKQKLAWVRHFSLICKDVNIDFQ